ncbi:MAG: chemotaxis protein CheW [bacterium]
MNKIDDEILQMYIEESQEHLADIEPDLLTIEKNGANIDEELVNKVFRAAHSIKGGSSFLGLTTIQEVSHKAENILEMIRSREMVPSPEVVNILLLAFDKLRDLINNHQESNNYDISEIMVSLTGLAASNLPDKQKESISKEIEIKVEGVATTLHVLEFDLNHAKNAGNHIYLIEFDLLHDIQRLGETPISLFKKLEKKGIILQCIVDFKAVGTLDDEPINRLPLVMLIATKEPLATSGELFEVPHEKIHLIYDPRLNQEQSAHHKQTENQDQSIDLIQAIAPAKIDEQAKNSNETIETDSPTKVSPSPVTQIETTLRVKVGLLETLMNLAGELVLSRNQLMEAITQNDQRSLKASAQQINLVASELQETIMLTRMQTIDKIFNKFPRVVHDMGIKLNKKVQLRIEGKDVEMDKTIIEGLSDPLTHMVRNAVDHGLETSNIRAALGKNPTGTITLRAYHRAGHVVIEVCDDGKGLDPKKIAASALAKGLISGDDIKMLSEKEKMGLIFLPGLSTSEKITDVSGRGVGMDVVKTNLEKLGGKIDIESEPGTGSIFRIKLPLTLAIIPSLLVSVEQERFAIPQLNVNELIRIAASQAKNRIEKIGGAEVLNLRGSLIPLIHLANVLGISKTYLDPNDNKRKPNRRNAIADRRSKSYSAADELSSSDQSVGEEEIIDQKKSLPARDWERRRGPDRRYHASSDLNIVVVTVESFQYGLIVDELHDTVEIVVKPLGQHLENAREYAGATIMGDGRVALILDVATIAEMEKLSSQAEHIRKRESDDVHNRKNLEESQSFMLFRNAIDEHCAILLDLVNRIEQIKASDIEIVAGKKMIQYRGKNLPLVTLSDAADVKSLAEGQNLVVIVFTIYGHTVGLLASRPIDIIEARVTIDQSTLKQKAIMGSSIINNHITMIIDIFELVERVYPEWVSKNIKHRPISDDAPFILLAEDSTFFRNQVKKFIEENGFNVFAAEDGQEAWDLLQKNADKVCMVVTDIEMPRLDGFGLAANIKGDKRFSSLPVIAVTTMAGETDIAKGKSVGIDDYQVKLDKERLLESINNYAQSYRA